MQLFLWFLLHFRQLNTNNSSLVDMYSRQDLQSVHLSLWNPSARLSTRLDNGIDINSKAISKLYFVCNCLTTFKLLFYSYWKRYALFCVFSLHSKCPLNSSARSLTIKWYSYLEPLWNTTRISFGVL